MGWECLGVRWGGERSCDELGGQSGGFMIVVVVEGAMSPGIVFKVGEAEECA